MEDQVATVNETDAESTGSNELNESGAFFGCDKHFARLMKFEVNLLLKLLVKIETIVANAY